MAIEFLPLPLPATADASKFLDFGRVVKGIDPGSLTEPKEFAEIREALYKYSVLVFHDISLTPEQQYALTKAFDPESENYGHNKDEVYQKSILNYINSIPRVPQVQLIGNSTVYDHEGVAEAKLKHPTHTTFHKTHISPEDEAKGITRFCRWHIDAALYGLSPPKVTTLYGVQVPDGPQQTVRYDDGSGDELTVPLAPTAFVSGKTMFDILPDQYKNLAVRMRVKYAPHPYVWVTPTSAMSAGLGIESEGLEKPLDQLPPWEESKQKTLPILWKNPVTGELHFQVHSWCVKEILIDPLPAGAKRENALYPDGTHITDLKEVRDLLYKMQRPAIAPSLVYPHEWRKNDMVLFHNRGVMHSVVGALKEDQLRVFHQCNIAASDDPLGPSEEDIDKWV